MKAAKRGKAVEKSVATSKRQLRSTPSKSPEACAPAKKLLKSTPPKQFKELHFEGKATATLYCYSQADKSGVYLACSDMLKIRRKVRDIRVISCLKPLLSMDDQGGNVHYNKENLKGVFKLDLTDIVTHPWKKDTQEKKQIILVDTLPEYVGDFATKGFFQINVATNDIKTFLKMVKEKYANWFKKEGELFFKEKK
jgi:hypothetical protein